MGKKKRKQRQWAHCNIDFLVRYSKEVSEFKKKKKTNERKKLNLK